MLIATILLLLFGWVTLLGAPSASLTLSPAVGALAAVTFVISLALYIKAPYKHISLVAGSVYILVTLTAGWAIIESGGASSPLIALWLAVGVFSGLFGWWGMGSLLLFANIYIIYYFLQGNTSAMSVIVNVLAAEIPILASYLLWNERETVDLVRDHDVSNLNKSLEKESSKSDAIIQSISDGVAVISPTGELQMINPAAEAMTGWSAKDAVHLHYSVIFKLQDAKGNAIASTDDPILQALNTSQPVRSSSLTLITKSDKRVAAAFAISPMGAAGEGAIAVFRDVTKERAEERQQAEFISTASHEMRTPVASIEGYLGLALNPNTASIDEKARDYITKAHESAQHLGRLFQDLLDVSKADDGRLQSNPKAVNVVDFTRTIAEGLSAQAQAKKLNLTFKPDGSKATTVGSTVIAPMLFAHVDKDHLREVISNLIENAIKYTLEGDIELDVTATDTYVRFSVKDSGVGIPAEDMSHLFQKFYRVDNSDTREIGGTGLGLYLCRKLVESMNGRIWAESEYRKGSAFYVELPRLDHTQANALLAEEKTAKTPDTETTKKSTAPLNTSEPNKPTPAVAASPAQAHANPSPQPATLPTSAVTPPATSRPTPVTIVSAPQPSAPTIPTPSTPQPATPPASAISAPLTPPALPPNPFGAIPYGPPEPATPSNATHTPQPAPQPTAPATPAPASPAHISHLTGQPRTNTPLSDLEADPGRYTISPQRANPPHAPQNQQQG